MMHIRREPRLRLVELRELVAGLLQLMPSNEVKKSTSIENPTRRNAGKSSSRQEERMDNKRSLIHSGINHKRICKESRERHADKKTGGSSANSSQHWKRNKR
jgi:hypothetical protein